MIIAEITNKDKDIKIVLDARALYPDCSLADLYDVVTMPPELLKAHQQNDRAVWEAYGKAGISGASRSVWRI